MSKWVRGIYNATANFNLSNALRATSGRIMGRNTEHVREECGKSNECKQSSESSKSNCSDASCTSATCTCTRTTSSCGRATTSCDKTRNIPTHVNGCVCSLCRDYNDYNEYSASIRTEGQGAGARIRVGNELKSFKHTNNGTATDVEYITGIQSGVTI